MAKTPQTSIKALGGKGAPKKSANKASCNVSVPPSRNGYESISVRPIDNGFIISHSTEKGYSETYSATKPKIEVPKAPKSKR